MIVENGVIKHTKGDTGGLRITRIVLDDGTEYTLKPGDGLIFTVRAKPSEDSPILIQMTTNTTEFTFTPADTKNLKPGRYSADVELITASGLTFTIWPKKKKSKIQPSYANFENFWLWPEVT